MPVEAKFFTDEPDYLWLNDRELPTQVWFVTKSHDIRPVTLTKWVLGGPKDEEGNYQLGWFVGHDSLEYFLGDPIYPDKASVCAAALEDLDYQEGKIKEAIAMLAARRAAVERIRDQ